MISKIADAISKHIKPISSAKSNPKQTNVTEKSVPPTVPEKKKSKKENPSEDSHRELSQKNHSDETPITRAPIPEHASVSSNFLDLFNRITRSHNAMKKWLALAQYEHAKTSQKQTAKTKKGSMMDSKAG